MEIARSSEKSVPYHKSARHHSSEEFDMNLRRYENLKSCSALTEFNLYKLFIYLYNILLHFTPRPSYWVPLKFIMHGLEPKGPFRFCSDYPSVFLPIFLFPKGRYCPKFTHFLEMLYRFSLYLSILLFKLNIAFSKEILLLLLSFFLNRPLLPCGVNGFFYLWILLDTW